MQAVLLLQVLHCQHVECPLNPVGRVLHQLIDLVDIGVAGEEMLVEGAAVVEPTQGSAVGSADNLDALVLSFRELTRKTKRLAVRVGDAEVEGGSYEWRRVVTEHERHVVQTILILSVGSLYVFAVLMDNLCEFIQSFGILSLCLRAHCDECEQNNWDDGFLHCVFLFFYLYFSLSFSCFISWSKL